MPLPQIAAGDIKPMRFVTGYTSADNKVVASSSGDMPFGISQMGTHSVPYSSLDDGLAAAAGEDIMVYQQGETCRLVLSGTVAANDLLKPDAVDGGGIAASAGDKYGARTLQAGTTGKIIEVVVQLGELET